MKDKIEAYFVGLGLDVDKARELRHVSIHLIIHVLSGSSPCLTMSPRVLQRYYTEYGLAIRGLVRHHQVDREPVDILSSGEVDPDKRARCYPVQRWTTTVNVMPRSHSRPS